MGRTAEVARLVAALVLSAGLAGSAAAAEATEAAGGGNVSAVLTGSELPLDFAEGLRVAAVSVRLDGSTGEASRDAELQREIEALAGALRDVPLQKFVAEGLLQRVRRVP